MFNKTGFKSLIFVLCALLILPLVFVSSNADASATDGSYIKGVEKIYIFSSEDEVNEGDYEKVTALGSSVKIYATAEGEELTDDGLVYSNGSGLTDTTSYEKYLTSFSYTSSTTQVKFTPKTTDNFVLSVVSTSDTNVKLSKVVSSINELPEEVVSYNFEGMDDFYTKLADYTSDFKAGDKFSESSFDTARTIDEKEYAQKFADLFDVAVLNYKSTGFKKTVHYAAPTSSWSTTTATGTSNFSFTASTAGHYKFYITVLSDKVGDNAAELSDEGLEEIYENGHYYLAKVYVDGDEVYAVLDGTSYIYYENEDQEEEVSAEGKTVTYTKVIPIFEFDVASVDFTVTPPTSTQEDGYIDSTYTMSGSFTIEGTSVNTTYKLYYSADKSTWTEDKDGWTESELELSSSNSFTPDAKGYYVIEATCVDLYGEVKTATCGVITVDKEFTKIKYVTAFSDWLEANTLPFIFLCISAACLIAIVLLLVIKPKKKEVEVAEEDN